MEINDTTPEPEKEVTIALKGEEIAMMAALADSLWWHLQTPKASEFLQELAETLSGLAKVEDPDDYFTGPSTLNQEGAQPIV